MTIVPPRGPDAYLYNIPIMVIGEAPGYNEYQERKPFVGKSGQEQEALLHRNGIDPRILRYTNVIQEYTEGNPDPTSEQIAYWTPVLTQDIQQFQPVLIIAVGAFATRWLLGSEATLEICHGIAHKPGCFDSSIRNRCPTNCIILPVYHPAAGFHDKTGDTRAVIGWDYSRVADIIRQIEESGIESIIIREDQHAGREHYADVTGADLSALIAVELLRVGGDCTQLIHGLDTEGVPGAEESIQWCPKPGFGYTLRVTQSDFQVGIEALQKLVDYQTLFVVHQASSPVGCCYDFTICSGFGLKLRYARIWDTMFAAYLLRLEPKGLKALAWRWCGMRLTPYMDTIGEIGKLKQIDYLAKVTNLQIPKPEPRIIFEHNGTVRSYKPSPLSTIAGKILKDIYSGKVNKDGETTDPWDRWKKTDKILRREIESHLGPMPRGTLADIPLEEATRYSGMDPDATLRLGLSLMPEIGRLGLSHCMEVGMLTLPTFWEMQQTGMPASREFFETLSADLHTKMDATQAELSTKFFCSQPFNPKSPKDVQDLMRRRGLVGTKKTATGGYSTSEESIGHLQYADDAIKLVFEWRGYQHDQDSYCADVLDRIPEDQPKDTPYPIRCNIRPATVATRRLSTNNPNLLAMKPSIRFGYVWPESEDRVFGAWDYSQIEMRMAAHLAQEPFLISIFWDGRDVHSETAAFVNEIKLDESIENLDIRYSIIPKPARRAAKTTNFGIQYGQGASGLLTELWKQGLTNYTKKSAENLINRVYGLYPVLRKYIEQTAKDAYESGGLVHDIWGMPRYLGGLFSDDSAVVAESERQAFSHKVQGGAKGMILNAIAYLGPIIQGLQESGLDIRWHLDIHDEIVFSFPPDLWDLMHEIVTDAMQNHCGIELLVPIVTEGHMGKSWGDLK